MTFAQLLGPVGQRGLELAPDGQRALRRLDQLESQEGAVVAVTEVGRG